VIITYHNEGRAFLLECLNQVKATIKLPEYEIIIVDDFSDEPLEPIDGVKIVRHSENKGVGQAFDTGVRSSKGENLILMACDMRFIDNSWAEKLNQVINDHPNSLICTACVGLNRNVNPETGNMDNMDFERRRKIQRSYGATILMFHDKKSNPSRSETFRGIIEAKWYPKQKQEVYEIPCILGACYGVKKAWYEYIDGWWGHNQWGTLEPYISLKSWLFGGNCLCASHIETGHIFKDNGPKGVYINVHSIKQDRLMYNKMLVATLLLPDYQRYIDFLGNNPIVNRAKSMIEKDKEKIQEKAIEYAKKTVFPIRALADRFDIDLRKEREQYEYM